ncbi:MAG: hypothetical protein KKH94_00390 [Candidatus Omnitrophica bacterium]|nr:hypothetical protein [Candidatus Omnitrophota bacterium]
MFAHIFSPLKISRNRQLFYCIIFFILLGGMLYYNSLDGEFIGDDFSLITENSNIYNFSLANSARLFSLPFFDSGGMRDYVFFKHLYYRPLIIMSYLLDYTIWHLVPFGYHLTNILLHVVSVILFFLFLQCIFNRVLFSFIAATIFLTHPLQSPHIASLSGRTDLLCLVFILLSVVSYAYFRGANSIVRKNIYILVSLSSFFCALLSKEIGIVIPALLIVYDLCFPPDNPDASNHSHPNQKKRLYHQWFRQAGTYSSFFFIFILYLIIRRNAVSVGMGDMVKSAFCIPYFYLRMLTVVTILISQIKTIIFPFPVYYYWRYIPLVTVPFGKEFWMSLFFLIILLSVMRLSWRRDKVIFFGIGWFLITYFPASNVIPLWRQIAPYTFFVGKQFLHIPLVGFCIVIGRLFFYSDTVVTKDSLKKIVQNIRVWFFISVVLLFSFLTMYYNIVWTNAIDYNQKVLEHVPYSSEFRNDLAIQYAQKGHLDAAAHLLTQAIAILESKWGHIALKPNSYINLAIIYSRVYEFEKLRNVCHLGIDLFPDCHIFYFFLAHVYIAKNDYVLVEENIRKALSLKPTFSSLARYFADFLYQHSSQKDVIEMYVERIKTNPSDTKALFRLASVYRLNYLFEEAAHFYQKVLSVDPYVCVARSNLAYCYEQLRQIERGEKEREKIGALSYGQTGSPSFSEVK